MNNEHWVEIREALLGLHKELLEFEKIRYEGKFGKIPNPGAFLNLLMENNTFAWLRQISELIVGLDELLDSKEEVSEQKFKDLSLYVKQLLSPALDGNPFQMNYYQAIHQRPSVALAHGRLQKLLQ